MGSEMCIRDSLFTVQGGFERKKLRGFCKLAAAVMSVFFRLDLIQKQNRTPHEDDMLDLLRHGGSRVSFENLGKVLGWYNYMLMNNMA